MLYGSQQGNKYFKVFKVIEKRERDIQELIPYQPWECV